MYIYIGNSYIILIYRQKIPKTMHLIRIQTDRMSVISYIFPLCKSKSKFWDNIIFSSPQLKHYLIILWPHNIFFFISGWYTKRWQLEDRAVVRSRIETCADMRFWCLIGVPKCRIFISAFQSLGVVQYQVFISINFLKYAKLEDTYKKFGYRRPNFAKDSYCLKIHFWNASYRIASLSTSPTCEINFLYTKTKMCIYR